MIKLSDSGLLANRHLAQEFSIQEFVSWYFENGRHLDSKKYGRVRIDSVGSDGMFAYFSRRNSAANMEFIKVKASELAGIHISKVEGEAIRQRFIAEIVPQADKDRVNRFTSTNFSSATFRYVFAPKTKTVLISYRWVVSQIFAKVINRTYSVTYDMAGNTFHDDAAVTINGKK